MKKAKTALRKAVGFVTVRKAVVAMLLVITMTFAFMNAFLDNVVYITDGDKVTVTVTSSVDPMEILEGQFIDTTENDLVSFVAPTARTVGEVKITRGYPVYLSADGQNVEFNWLGGTTADLLEEAGLTLGKYDKITPELDHELKSGDEVVVTRVKYRSYDEKVRLPKPIKTKQSSLIRRGSTRIIEPGEDGLRIDTYDEILENGVVVETVLRDSVVEKQPVTETRLYGTDDQISNIDYSDEFPLDANGNPIKYTRVLRNQRATGYWRGGSAWGANGQYCEAGTVAIRSEEIPYGSKLYIKTPDGDFIYGYSYANDTGTALMEGVIDVDLFYDSYKESCWNSVRYVDIYVLEEGDNKYYHRSNKQY